MVDYWVDVMALTSDKQNKKGTKRLKVLIIGSIPVYRSQYTSYVRRVGCPVGVGEGLLDAETMVNGNQKRSGFVSYKIQP